MGTLTRFLQSCKNTYLVVASCIDAYLFARINTISYEFYVKGGKYSIIIKIVWLE